MPKYAVVKYFGHFRQDWSVDANTKEEAWNIAESNGYLDYQTAYHEVFDTKGYVVDLSKKESNFISKDEYKTFLLEAKELGMKIMPEYMRILEENKND
jgi:hypothetical protein